MNSSKVCKTFIRRFNSDPRLQSNPTENKVVTPPTTHFPPSFEGSVNAPKTAKSWRRASGILTGSLTESLTAASATGTTIQYSGLRQLPSIDLTSFYGTRAADIFASASPCLGTSLGTARRAA